MSDTFKFQPIGVVAAGADGFAIEIDQPYREALTGLEDFSHVSVQPARSDVPHGAAGLDREPGASHAELAPACECVGRWVGGRIARLALVPLVATAAPLGRRHAKGLAEGSAER